jgi:hypothetical protein
MAFKHGKDTVFKVNSVDLSAYTSESEINRGTDTHDVSGYGVAAHAFGAGLNTGTASASGTYDSTASTGPRAALLAVYALNASVTVLRQPEGTGTGKPQDSFSGILTSYVETNPVADYVKWKAEFQITGNINTAAQV